MTEKTKPKEDRTVWRGNPVCSPWTPIPRRLMEHWHRVGYHETDPRTGKARFVRLGDGCFATVCWAVRWARADVADGLRNIDMSIRGASRERGIGSSAISKHLIKLERAGVFKVTRGGPRTTPLIDASPLIALLQGFETQAAREKAEASMDFSQRLVGLGLQICACWRPNCPGCGRPRKRPPEEQPQFGEPDHDSYLADESAASLEDVG